MADWIWTGETHPLLQEPILDILFGFIPDSDIPIIRQVCETWRKKTLKVWGDTRTLHLEQSLGRRGTAVTNDERCFVYHWMNRKIPAAEYKHVELKNWDFRIDFEEQQVGNIFKAENEKPESGFCDSLTLRRCTFEVTSVFLKLIVSWFPRTTKLTLIECSFGSDNNKSSNNHIMNRLKANAEAVTIPPVHRQHVCISELELRTNGRELRHQMPYIPHVDMLSHLPKITNYTMNTDWRGYKLLDLLDAVERLRNVDPTMAQIKNIHIVNNVELETVMPRLLTLGIGMERLFVPSTTKNQEMKTMLEANKDVLKTLIISCYRDTTYPRHDIFPFDVELKNLVTFEIGDRLHHNLGCLEKMPNLQKLAVNPNYYDDNQRMSKLVANVPLDTMKNFSLPTVHTLSYHYPLPAEDFERLVGWLPNLKYLTLQASNEIFKIICQKCQKLRKLKMLTAELTDEVIIGWKPPRRSSVQPKVPSNVAHNITMLKDLRVFEASSVTFGEHAVRFGFLQMSRLEKLFYLNCTFMSAQLRIQLADKNIDLERDTMMQYNVLQ